MMIRPSFFFGSFLLNPSQIFFETSLSVAIVNLKPIVPGHVLIIPKRVEARLLKLTMYVFITKILFLWNFQFNRVYI